MTKRLLLGLVLILPAAAAAQPAQPQPAPRALTLDDALRTARAHQPTLMVSRAQTEQARARVDEARSALFPQVTGRALYQRTQRESGSGGAVVVGGQVSSGGGGGSDLFQASVSVTQLLWDFGQTTGRVHAAEASADAQEATGQVTIRDTLLNVRTIYFECRADKALVDVARETLANQQKHLEQVQAFIDVGTRPEIDLAQSKTDVANARLALIRAENSYATARARLNQAMGVAGRTDYDVVDENLPPIAGEDAPIDDVLRQAYAARPELRALAATRRSQEEVVSSTRGAYYPTISLSGSALESGDALSNLGWALTGTVNLSWNLFQGGLTKAQVREAELGEVIVDAQTETERQAVRVEADNALLAVRGAKSEISAAEEALANARERLRLAEGRYQTGVGSIIELGDAQVALTNAAAQKVQADYDLATARAQLVHALGQDAP